MKKEQLQKQFEYILDRITSDYCVLNTELEKINYFVDRFSKEYNDPYNKKRWPNTQDRIKEYLMGLPFGIDYENYRIIEIGKLWGFCGTPAKENSFVSNWFNVCAFRIIQLCQRNGINVHAL